MTHDMMAYYVSNSIFFISLEDADVIQELLSETTTPIYTSIHTTWAYISFCLELYTLI